MIQIKNKTLVIIFLSVIVATFAGGWLLGRFARDRASEGLISSQSVLIKTYVYQIGDLKKKAAETEQLVFDLRYAVEMAMISKEEYRKLAMRYVNEMTALQLQVDTLLQDVEHNGQIIHIDSTIVVQDYGESVIVLPFTFKKSDMYMTLGGSFSELGNLDISLKLDANVDVWTGIDKKTKAYKAVVTTDNPYINTIGISSIKMDLEPVRRWGIGITGGYGIGYTNKKISPFPFIGIGLTRNFIRF